jgi:D-glycero-alpha-D-manno-heptose-7-phosphate kinase
VSDKGERKSEGVVRVTHGRASVNRQTVIRAKAPLRVSFAGGGTDLVQWYEEHGGAVLSSTINRYSYVTLYPREDDEIRIRSFDLGTHVNYKINQELFDGVLDLAKAAIRRMGIDLGFELDVYTEAPRGSGLGGSSAVTSAILGAVREYTGVVLDAYELAELNYTIERTDLGIAGGKQDQYATTFGGFNMIEFHRDRVLVTPLRVDRDILNDLEAHVFLCYTGQVRSDLGIIEKQMEYYQSRQDTITAMKKVHQQVYQMMEALLKGRLNKFGELLDEAYQAKKEMNPHVSTSRVDELYALAKKEGALGGKLLGAGGGGYLMLYIPGARVHDVRKALEAQGGQFASFAFEERGLQVWRSRCR